MIWGKLYEKGFLNLGRLGDDFGVRLLKSNDSIFNYYLREMGK